MKQINITAEKIPKKAVSTWKFLSVNAVDA